MEAISLLGMLSICTYEDIRWRRIEIVSVLGFAVLGFVMHLFRMQINLADMLGGMLIGVVLLAISLYTEEIIGKGDALIVLVSGIYIGFWNNLILVWGASILAGIFGVVYIVKGQRKKEIPFVPFLLSVYILILLLNGGFHVS